MTNNYRILSQIHHSYLQHYTLQALTLAHSRGDSQTGNDLAGLLVGRSRGRGDGPVSCLLIQDDPPREEAKYTGGGWLDH